MKQKSQTRQRHQAKPPAKADDKNQSRAFIEKARELGCDENHTGADELLGRLAKMPPNPKKPKTRKL